MENIKTISGTCFINGKHINMSEQAISAKHNHETQSGRLFKNADGELFFDTLKIGTIRPLKIKDKIKRVFMKGH